MHKISHLVESYRTCLFGYLIGGQLLGVTAYQSQLFSPCKVILLISFINSFLFFALPYPFKDTRRCKSNNTTKERNILWHSTTQNQWNENYVMGNSTFFFCFLGQVLHSNTRKEEISTHFLTKLQISAFFSDNEIFQNSIAEDGISSIFYIINRPISQTGCYYYETTMSPNIYLFMSSFVKSDTCHTYIGYL